jgi:pimeloyl-ACP methyl ester carboxylesterase
MTIICRLRAANYSLAAALLALAFIIAPATARALPSYPDLPKIPVQGHVEHETARIWYGTIGEGPPVILLHGGTASSRTWSLQVPALAAAGYRIILIDSRGHGRSTLGTRPLGYELMERDVLAVMDRLKLRRAAIVGWSDGAIIGLILAMRQPQRLTAVYAFGANMDQKSVRPDAFNAPILKTVGPRLLADYAARSPTPNGFPALRAAAEAMLRAEPNYTAAELGTIASPAIMIAPGANDEFIKSDHPAYLGRTIPGATLQIFPDAGHFAPWEQAQAFNQSLLDFLLKARANPSDRSLEEEPHFKPR